MGQTDRAGMGDMEVGGGGYACRSRSGCEWVWASLGRYGQVWMGQTDRMGMGDKASMWVWVCKQV